MQFYGRRISDKTVVGQRHTWGDLKEEASKPDYKKQEWYKDLTEYERDLLERLKSAQEAQGDMDELKVQPDSRMNEAFITERVE